MREPEPGGAGEDRRGRPDSPRPGPDDLVPEPGDPVLTSFSSFDRLVRLCRRTRAVLLDVAGERGTEQAIVRSAVAAEALEHVDAVLAGITYLARTSAFSAAELRELVRRAGITAPPSGASPDGIAADAEAAAEARAGRRGLATLDHRVLLAAGHARVVFSVIPALPPAAVGWPRAYPTYADIPVPRTEAELMLRVEELARVLWRVAAGDAPRDEPLRRTLAFYDAGAQLPVRAPFLPA